MSQTAKFRIFMRIAVLFGIAVLLMLSGFQAVPIASASDTQQLYQASLQMTRSQIIAKSALTLAYRPMSERAHAISDLQVILPLFQQEQDALLTDKASDVQLLLQQARPDYLSLVAAGNMLVANQDHAIDPIQVNIILNANVNYLHSMNAIILLLQQHADERTLQLFLIETGLDIILLAIALIVLSRTEHILFRVLAKKENHE